jgi:parallel beta helix pectate lyase-like protein
MGHASHLLSRDARVRAAWPVPLAAAEPTPGLWPDLVRRRDELLPRAAAYYTHLQALPRRVRRALQRHWGVPLATLALWLALGQLPALAATIPVGGGCTLVDAITAANTDAATGGCPAGSGADTIVLPPGSTQTLTTVHNDTYGPTGLPVISTVITIAGQESTIARASGAPAFRLLAVTSTGDLTLQETTVSGGASAGYPGGYCGGVANYGGTLTITNSTISGITAGSGVANSGGTLTITNSTISGNTGGGGVANYGGTLTITNSTISGNSGYFSGGYFGPYFGGGVYAGNGTFTITDSTIADNTGGGVASAFGTLTITNSTISGNTGGGGVDVASSTGTITNSTISGNTSSGVENVGSTLTITNSTISGNTAGVGGGVLNRGLFDSYSREYLPGTLIITNSTISSNTAGTRGGGVANSRNDLTLSNLTLIRTLVSGNTSPVGPEVFNDGAVVADNHNLFGVDGDARVVGFSPGATDVVPPPGVRLPDILDPTLALHGGRTATYALVPGSPAIDAGGPVCLDATGAPLTTDQRGRPRPVDGNGDGLVACDIGAFEFFPLVNDLVTLDPDLDTGFDPTPVPGGPAGTFTVTATFTNTSATPLRAPFFEVTALSGGNLLLNADDGPGGVGATLTPAVGDGVLAPGETVAADFVLGLQERTPFTFVVELFGEPGP